MVPWNGRQRSGRPGVSSTVDGNFCGTEGSVDEDAHQGGRRNRAGILPLRYCMVTERSGMLTTRWGIAGGRPATAGDPEAGYCFVNVKASTRTPLLSRTAVYCPAGYHDVFTSIVWVPVADTYRYQVSCTSPVLVKK